MVKITTPPILPSSPSPRSAAQELKPTSRTTAPEILPLTNHRAGDLSEQDSSQIHLRLGIQVHHRYFNFRPQAEQQYVFFHP